ncbi:MAG: hypothetical protein K2X29_01920 [Candidatus Obscuribacterales bacterium]|nr:hypothetical protein [Candidatus Obscuribacterales bacterium]
MSVPAWSSFSNLPASQAAFERWTFQTLLLERLSELIGIALCTKLSAVSPEAQALVAALRTDRDSGILYTNNSKRHSTSFSLILEGECIACVYSMGNTQLKESVEICSKAVQRDLDNESTQVSFSGIDKELTNSLAAIFVGVSQYQLQGFCLQDEVERLLNQPLYRERTALIVASIEDAIYHVFINNGTLIGVMATIYSQRGPKLGFSRDSSMLTFESKYNVEAYMEIFAC